MSESRLAITANARFALARRNVTFCDLDAPFEHAPDPVPGGVQYAGYQLSLPDTPGIDAAPDPAFLKKLVKVNGYFS